MASRDTWADIFYNGPHKMEATLKDAAVTLNFGSWWIQVNSIVTDLEYRENYILNSLPERTLKLTLVDADNIGVITFALAQLPYVHDIDINAVILKKNYKGPWKLKQIPEYRSGFDGERKIELEFRHGR